MTAEERYHIAASMLRNDFKRFKEEFALAQGRYVEQNIPINERLYTCHPDQAIYPFQVTQLMEHVILCDNIEEFKRYVQDKDAIEQINSLTMGIVSALSLAARFHLYEKCEVLLDHGALVAHSDDLALREAVFALEETVGSDTSTISLLLQRGAPVSRKVFENYIYDSESDTALDLDIFNRMIITQPSLLEDGKGDDAFFACIQALQLGYVKAAFMKRDTIRTDAIRAFRYIVERRLNESDDIIEFLIEYCELDIFKTDCLQHLRPNGALTLLRIIDNMRRTYKDQTKELKTIKDALADSQENAIIGIVMTYVTCSPESYSRKHSSVNSS